MGFGMRIVEEMEGWNKMKVILFLILAPILLNHEYVTDER